MTWAKFYVSDSGVDFHANVNVRLAFNNALMAAGAPKGLSLFEVKDEPLGGTTYYAPYYNKHPEWNQLLARYGAQTCEMPDGSLVKPVMEWDAWECWFGDKDKA